MAEDDADRPLDDEEALAMYDAVQDWLKGDGDGDSDSEPAAAPSVPAKDAKEDEPPKQVVVAPPGLDKLPFKLEEAIFPEAPAGWAAEGDDAKAGLNPFAAEFVGGSTEFVPEAQRIQPAIQEDSRTQTLLTAIHSLYRDLIRPTYAMVKRRLTEMNHDFTFEELWLFTLNRPDLVYLMPGPQGTSQDAMEAIMFVHSPLWFEGFCDPTSPHNEYPYEVWRSLKKYFALMPEPLPTDTYSAAQVLRDAALPAIRSYSLGQILHMVNLALGPKEMLRADGEFLVVVAKPQRKRRPKPEPIQSFPPTMLTGITLDIDGQTANIGEGLQRLMADHPEGARLCVTKRYGLLVA